MRLWLTIFLLGCSFASVASAQRRSSASAPVDVALLADASRPYLYRVSVVARVDAEIVADLRWLHLEVRAAGSRRGLSCDAPGRPRRITPDAIRTLRSGEVWTETFDVRTICWGRALAALSGGGQFGGTLGTARTHTGARATPGGTFRPAPIPFSPVAAIAPASAPAGEVRVALAPADAITGSRLTLRVVVRSARPVRAWVDPDRLRFRVRSSDGTEHVCSMTRHGGSPIPDLFARVSSRGGPTFSLEARAFCARGVFEHAGVYEVTPILDLDVDGREWRMDTPLGTFEGAPSFVRIRSDS